MIKFQTVFFLEIKIYVTNSTRQQKKQALAPPRAHVNLQSPVTIFK